MSACKKSNMFVMQKGKYFYDYPKRLYEIPKTLFGKKDKYLQTNGVYMRASGITLVSGPLVTITPQ